MKIDKLYTVTKGNKNFFNHGGPSGTGAVTVNTNSGGISGGYTPHIDWSNALSRAQALGNTSALVKNFRNDSTNSFNWNLSSQNVLGQGSNGSIAGDNPLDAYGTDKLASAFNNGSNGSSGGSSWRSALAGAGQGLLAMADKVPTGDRRGLWDTLDPGYNAGKTKFADGSSGHYETKVGNALSDIGIALTGGGASNALGALGAGGDGSKGGYAALAGAAFKITGDVINNGWGMAYNDKKIGEVKQNTRDMQNTGNALAQAKSINDLINASGYMRGASDYSTDMLVKGGVFKKEDARNEGYDFLNRENSAQAYQNKGLRIGAENMDRKIDDRARSTFRYDYGGFLGMPMYNDSGMGAIDYGFKSDYLSMKKKQAESKNTLSTMPPVFALGGVLQSHGSDWSDGLTIINAGSSHELNPYQGVQMGTDSEGIPNLVEENETIWNDYVFSNRIYADGGTLQKMHLPKKSKLTFSDITKRLEKEIEERPNDPISKLGFNSQMAVLRDEQERQKQEMEAKKAQAAFDALSPEEQVAIMNNVAQQEAMQEQAAMQQQEEAAMQQPSPEEMAMMQQQQMMQADGSQAMVNQEAPMMAAYGGEINKYDNGGMKKKIYDLLGLKTQSDWNTWAKKNGLDEMNDVEDWDNILQNQAFISAITKDNPALRHALENKYDFGMYTPSAKDRITFPSITQGNWKKQTYEGWKDSKDPGWLEAVENWKNTLGDNWAETVKGYNREQIAEALRNTKAFQRGTKWLQDSEDNRLRYLRELYSNAETPVEAKKYALKFIDENGNWRADGARDYETIFNNPSGRAANPGTYWHTPLEAVRDAVQRNYVINKDGTVELLEGNVDGLTLDSTYKWADPQSDYVNNYYKRAAQVAGDDAAKAVGDAAATAASIDEEGVEPRHRNETLRYAGLFGPAAGLLMQASGFGRPDPSSFEAAVAQSRAGTALADYKPIGDYLMYRPMDIWAEQNRLDAIARAAERTIMNSSMPTSSKYAALLASNYGNQIANGNSFRNSLEYNDNLRKMTGEFNKDTNKFDADAYNRTSQFNAEALNRAKQTTAGLAFQAAKEKADADAAWNSDIYKNVGNLFKGLSELGRENTIWNMIADNAADGVYGNLGDSYTGKRAIKKKSRKKGLMG